MTTRLLIDNSNTRTKFALAHNSELCGNVRILRTNDLSAPAIQNLLHDWEYDTAVVCSVVPEAMPIFRSTFSCPTCEISAQFPTEFGKKLLRYYSHPETLGADRLANAAAVAAYAPLPCIAADLGTACTFDAVILREGTPALIGGVIAPGLRALTTALPTTTAQLPSIPLPNSTFAAFPNIFATDTRQAMLSGCILGFRGMVDGILRSFGEQLNCSPAIILSGGDASLCASLPHPAISIDKLLTFKGMLRLIL